MKRIFSIIVLLLSIFNLESYGFTKYVTANLNLRYKASTNSRILIVIPRGTAVTIDEDCDCKWVPIEYNGYVGYISTKYLSKNPPVRKYTSKKNSSARKKYTSTRSRRGGGVRYYTNTYGNRVQSPHIMIHDLQELQHYVETEPIVLVRAVGEHARIMVALLDGTKCY